MSDAVVSIPLNFLLVIFIEMMMLLPLGICCIDIPAYSTRSLILSCAFISTVPVQAHGLGASSMLYSILLVEYTAVMDAPLTTQLLSSRRADVCKTEKRRWRIPCRSYYLQPLVKAIMASEDDLEKERADAALLSAHRFGLPRTGALMSVIAQDEMGSSGVDPGARPASESRGSPSPRNRLPPQPRKVAARDLVSGVLQSMKLEMDFTLYHTDLPVAAQRTTGHPIHHHLRSAPNPKKLTTPLTLRWIDLTSHENLTQVRARLAINR